VFVRSAVVDRHGAHVGHRNTWGDAIYVVLDGASEAAACALDLQEAHAVIDLPAAGLPEHLALRLGGHLGPVFPVRDPVLGSERSWGRTSAARRASNRSPRRAPCS
jgi:hypothetical protein